MTIPLNEKQLQDAVLELAGVLGWRRAHFRPARTKNGWRTPVEGDGKGFPDLILLRGPRMIVAELKSEMGRISEEQGAWLAAFKAVQNSRLKTLVRLGGTESMLAECPEIYVWIPVHWDDGTIEALLR